MNAMNAMNAGNAGNAMNAMNAVNAINAMNLTFENGRKHYITAAQHGISSNHSLAPHELRTRPYPFIRGTAGVIYRSLVIVFSNIFYCHVMSCHA